MAPCNGTTPQSWSPCPPTMQWHPAMAPRPLPWPSPSSPNHSTLQRHPAMAANNTPPKLAVTYPNHSTQWHRTMARAMAPSPLPQSWSSPSPPMAPCNGTQQWTWSSPSPPTIAHHNGSPQWHPAMAPHPLPQSWSSPYPNHSTQWHRTMAPAMAPRPLPQSWSSPSPPIAPLQWHPAMKLVLTLPPNHSTLQWHPTMGPSNGTSTATCNSTGATSNPPKWFVTPPLLEVRTPITIAILGKTSHTHLPLRIPFKATPKTPPKKKHPPQIRIRDL